MEKGTKGRRLKSLGSKKKENKERVKVAKLGYRKGNIVKGTKRRQKSTKEIGYTFHRYLAIAISFHGSTPIRGK